MVTIKKVFKISLLSLLSLSLLSAISSDLFASQNTYELSNTKTYIVTQNITIPKSDYNLLSNLTVKGSLINDAERVYADPYFYEISGEDATINHMENMNYNFNINNPTSSNIDYKSQAITKTKVSFIEFFIEPNNIKGTSYPDEVNKFLLPSNGIESNNEKIVKKGIEIINGEVNPYYKAKKIYNFIYQYLNYDLERGNNTALHALETKVGVCEDYARLMVALLRSQNIPARTVSGYKIKSDIQNVDLTDGLYNHMWVEFYLNGYGWIPADPTITFADKKFETEVTFAKLFDYYYIPITIDKDMSVAYSYSIQSNQIKEDISLNITTIGKTSPYNENTSVEGNKITLTLDSLISYINGVKFKLDITPYSKDGRTMVPLRFISENLNADIKWIDKTNQILIKKDNNSILLTLNKKEALINGKNVILDASPEIFKGRTMVPLRFISENLNTDIKWNQKTKTIIIMNKSGY